MKRRGKKSNESTSYTINTHSSLTLNKLQYSLHFTTKVMHAILHALKLNISHILLWLIIGYYAKLNCSWNRLN